ncbi:MAG: hypothetical protein A2271_03835 [Candidatus Moranbacteria bacterium RIFOXYA12_FULL_35_19]|nr:MAG: hypothetical protein UR78_C0003G0038 [Candidatus Moranbacteria bacterium GW2011_GWF2_35_39]OGI32099.1 MAG: hypothetical protein A2343_02235 [Candidatus Moranbacteria bacterium RIFOXYB12_FULL_35_8]OGI33347.1 MAG: hypothetical protein A2489_03780 [Candidatus Moranbacteria bacterium RIFOXYC12_FULL_36_13]OGI36303.1 MAG: hypothetical protein A2271_03835 [Candidatus Moranbacteria bacterium RIFOXYA12_FULL_35_19]
MKKPAIMVRLGVTTHKKLVELIKKNAGGGREISILKHTNDTTLIIITNYYHKPALRETICVKDTIIYASEMIGFLTNLLLKANLAFVYEPELEMQDYLQELIRNFTLNRQP